ncbi:MAG: VanZ family protein [Clostridia bacterium]
MKRIINGSVIILSAILIGFVMIFSILPNFTLNSVITIGGFIIPSLIIIVTMIIQIKKSNDKKEKNRIRIFWIKILFIIYCLLLITILFFNNEYRVGIYEDTKIFSKEHFNSTNIIPFNTIIEYIKGLITNNINKKIVISNLGINLILFAPMGVFISILFKDKIKNIKQFILAMIIVLFSVEMLQFITLRGSMDIDDIILNITGAIVGYELMQLNWVKNLYIK